MKYVDGNHYFKRKDIGITNLELIPVDRLGTGHEWDHRK
jgi:hypothetical protein